MESAGAQILKQVVDAPEIEQVSTGNEWEFRYKNNVNFTVYTVKQEVPCCILRLLYTHWQVHHFGRVFISNLSKMAKFSSTYLHEGEGMSYSKNCR